MSVKPWMYCKGTCYSVLIRCIFTNEKPNCQNNENISKTEEVDIDYFFR